MWNYRATFWIILLCYLTLQAVRAESNGPAKETKTIGTNEAKKSKPEKRDSYRQEGTPSESKNRQQTFSNDEPFRPIYRPAYNAPQRNAPQKFEQYLSQAIVPQAETYYAKPQLIDVERYVAPSHNGNAGSSGATPPAHSAAPPLIGSYLSSIAGVRYASDAYRGPYSPAVQQIKPQPTAVQKPSTVKVAPATHKKVKGPTNASAYVQPVTSFSFDHASKPFHQNDDEQQQQQRLILRPLNQVQHQQQEPQPHFHFDNPHQHQHQHQSLHHTQLNTRAGPQQQQHFQYIIAIPLSYVRQLQHQLATGSAGPTLRHEVPLSASKSEYVNPAHSAIGPLARDHHGSYQPVHYTSNYLAHHVSPTVQHHSNNQGTKPQYTTQYIQIPASVLNTALQTAHAYPNRQHEHGPTARTTASQQSQPQFAYNNYQHQQAQQHQIQNHSPVYVHQAQEKPQTQEKPLQEAIIHVEGAKPSAKSTPTKTYIDNTQIPSTSTASFKAPATNSIASPETLPIVHYNPIYVQGPPTEQQSLFGSGGGGVGGDTLNYHRFATGGFHAPSPLSIIRLSATPSQHFYNSLPQYHPYHQQQHQHYHQSPSPSQSQTYLPYRMAMEHKTVYGGYTPEQIPSITQGLPYFTHPGGVHYGTHLYHQTPAFVASPSIAAKATETENGSSVGNRHQLEQQQQQQSFHPHYDAPTANGSAASSPLVKYP